MARLTFGYLVSLYQWKKMYKITFVKSGYTASQDFQNIRNLFWTNSIFIKLKRTRIAYYKNGLGVLINVTRYNFLCWMKIQQLQICFQTIHCNYLPFWQLRQKQCGSTGVVYTHVEDNFILSRLSQPLYCIIIYSIHWSFTAHFGGVKFVKYHRNNVWKKRRISRSSLLKYSSACINFWIRR